MKIYKKKFLFRIIFDETPTKVDNNIGVYCEQNFRKFTSETINLPLKDIDTDLIIPAEFLNTTEKSGLGAHVFSNLRKQVDFPQFKNQRILVAGKNFGCGSSREHAVWALKEVGIDVIVSSEFADIFRGNAEKNGILLIKLPENVVQKFLTSKEKLTIDLINQNIIDIKNQKYHFEIDPFVKTKLLENISDLGYLMKHKDKILEFEKNI